MEYKVFEMDGSLVSEGDDLGLALSMLETNEAIVPTHGSISVRLGVMWVNFKTSEWLTLTVSDEAESWKAR